MRKENGKRESPYKGILKFADEKKPQLSFAVVLSVLSSAFGIVPYIAVAILLQKALASSLTTTWAILLPVIALCGYLLKHTLYAKSTLCSHNMTWFTQVSTDFDFSLHTTYGGYYDPFLTMTNMNPEMMSDPILWQVALTMENGTDTIKELDSTADLDRVQEIYNQVLTFAADQAVLVPFTSAHQYAAFNSEKIDSFSFGSDQLFIEIANVKAK